MNKNAIHAFLFFSLIFLYSACNMETSLSSQFVEAVDEIRLKHAPDKRIAVFNFEHKFEDNIFDINLETDKPEAATELTSAAEKLLEKDSYKLTIDLLPSKELGDSSYAIVNISVANLRRMPKYSAELIDQSVMGTPLKILKEKGYWYLIQTPYDYIGWMGKSSFILCSKQDLDQWKKLKRVKVTSTFAQVFLAQNSSALPLSDAVYGSELKYINSSGSWYKVALPDNNTGFIGKKYCKISSDLSKQKTVNPDRIINTAKTFLGIPYLWGGNSTKGLDCSGFVQTVYKSQGILLPRDANMQVNIGEKIKPAADFGNVKKGDLLFFGADTNKITHAAISLGGADFIHSSGNVHINSFNKDKDNFNSYRYKSLRYIKRIVND